MVDSNSNAISLSVVITTFNRAAIVSQSICSVQDAFEKVPDYEIVVVDDASTDDTVSLLHTVFADEIVSGRIKIVRNRNNRGVTGSKNQGYIVAGGGWVIFLDSDDTLLPSVGEHILSALNIHADKPLVFFRCIDQNGNFVGTRFENDVTLDLKTYLEHTSFGEALTAVNKRIVQQEEPYLEFLRGYEGIGCCRIIANHGSAVLSELVARHYDCSSKDRLSVSTGLFQRMPLLAQGHLILVREFGAKMRWHRAVGYIIKAAVYGLIGNLYRLTKGNLK